MPLTYAFRLAPGPQALDQAMLAEKLGYERPDPNGSRPFDTRYF